MQVSFWEPFQNSCSMKTDEQGLRAIPLMEQNMRTVNLENRYFIVQSR